MYVGGYTHCEDMSPKEETQDNILKAALQLFVEHGFRATTTKSIAEKAGVNEITLFRYFGTKDKLFYAVLEQEGQKKLDLFDFEVSEQLSGDLIEDLTAIGELIESFVMGNAVFFKLMVQDLDRNPELMPQLIHIPLEGISKLMDYFDKAKEMGLVRKDVDTELIAVSFFNFFFRVLFANAFLGADPFMSRKDETIRTFVEIFVNGVVDKGEKQ